jgi:hypothetical protein
MEHDRGVFLPALGTIVFVLLVPGTVVVAVPYLLTRWLGAALLACEHRSLHTTSVCLQHIAPAATVAEATAKTVHLSVQP